MSNIDPSKPSQGQATTKSVRDNFGVTKSEIEAIWVAVDGLLVEGAPGPAVALRMWAGALTDHSFRVMFDMTAGVQNCGLAVSLDATLTSPVFRSANVAPVATAGMTTVFYSADFTATGLAPDTTYYYAPVFNGVINVHQARTAKTAPVHGVPAHFKFVFGSCSYPFDISNATLYQAPWPGFIYRSVRSENPLFLLHLGDLDYSDVGVNDVRVQRTRNSRKVRDDPDFDNMLQSVPFAYMYDDHDFGLNDSLLSTTYLSGTTHEIVGRASRQAVRETTPVYSSVQTALGETNIDHNLLTQVWDIGTVRFIVPDLKAQRDVSQTPPTCLGTGAGGGDWWDQRTWLKSALNAAQADGITYIVLCSTSGWTGSAAGWSDQFPQERSELCDTILGLQVPVLLLTGDLHESAADDGTNTGFSADGRCGFPQLMSSPMSNEGVNAANGQFIWNGLQKRFRSNAMQYCVVEMFPDGRWTATFKGGPVDPATFEATTLGVVASDDLPLTVAMAGSTSLVGVAGAPLTVFARKTSVAARACSVSWATNDSQSGGVTFLPNSRSEPVVLAGQTLGHVTQLTLSSPVGCALGAPAVVNVSFTVTNAETAAAVNLMSVAPSAGRVTLYDSFIGTLKSSGVWAKLDLLYLLAAHSQQAAYLNLKTPGAFALSQSGGGGFVVDSGFAGDGGSGFLTSGFSPVIQAGANFTNVSNHLAVWSLTDFMGDVTDISFNSSVAKTRIDCRRNGNLMLARCGDQINLQGTNPSSLGFHFAGRSASNARSIRKTTTQLAADLVQAEALVVGDFMLGALARNTNYSPRRYAFASVGGSLTATQADALQGAVAAWLAGL